MTDLRWRTATKELLTRTEIETDLRFYIGQHAPGFTSREAYLRLLRTAFALYEKLEEERDDRPAD